MALEALIMDERGAWRIELESGQVIRLGRRDVDERLDRFFQVAAPVLVDEFDRVRHVDLRYTNGFSVGWLTTGALQLAGAREVLGSG